MDHSCIAFALIGFSAAFFLCLPNLKKWQSKKIRREKLGMITEVLEKAEERIKRHEERHDRILSQTCSYYLLNRDLEETLTAARAALNEALEFAAGIRDSQMKLIMALIHVGVDVDEHVINCLRGQYRQAREHDIRTTIPWVPF